jgi:pimeloyl-ACP methyl ester carboxylesterase
MGFATLSIQLPVQKSDAQLEDYYPTVFPEAVERIRAAGDWLQQLGYRRVVLLSHSMGSWMANVYYEKTVDPPFAAWVCMGLTGGFSGMRNVRAPVLDVYGEHDLPSVARRLAPSRDARLDRRLATGPHRGRGPSLHRTRKGACGADPRFSFEPQMTLTELRYLVAVARERHFGHAAESCFVSQPTLSVAIKKLEEELGVALFERGPGEVGSRRRAARRRAGAARARGSFADPRSRCRGP